MSLSFKVEKAKRIEHQQWNEHIVSKLKRRWYLINTVTTKNNDNNNSNIGSNNNTDDCCPNNNYYDPIINDDCTNNNNNIIYSSIPKNQLPDGIYYQRNFLSCTEEQRTLIQQTIDQNLWSTVIARRQQFYGDIYYHTKHDVPSIQPLLSNNNVNDGDENSSIQKSTLMNNNSPTTMNGSNNTPNDDNNNNNNNNDTTNNNYYSNVPPSMELEEMDWIIKKLNNITPTVPGTNDGYFEYLNNIMYYYSTPPGVFTATKSTTPIIIRPVNKINDDDDAITIPVPKPAIDNEDIENPTQILVNEYIGTIGIHSHIDDPFAFGQVLVMISLNDPVVMRLLRTPTTPSSLLSNTNTNNNQNQLCDEVHLLLEPRSVLILKGQARYEYEHSITKQKWIAINHPVVTNNDNDKITVKNKECDNDDDELYKFLDDIPMEEWKQIVTNCKQHTTDDNGNLNFQQLVDPNNNQYCKYNIFLLERTETNYRRISLTVRHLLAGRKRVTVAREYEPTQV